MKTIPTTKPAGRRCEYVYTDRTWVERGIPNYTHTLKGLWCDVRPSK